ncbi:septal ring factor EnvC (AmiA/AmiB activator) [Pseudomonas sp. BIGb0408]|uniref:Lipoprotein n=3 Tax=Pseudomonadales TaxID=72274 RepID=A0A0D0JSR4_9PSED|nr:lipoprotein [Pseudomonas fulva]MCW2293091.1 septal ring factor EnvC (AmiA/AmiB activator) [Pseudomonas sp. BIGb0408]NYH72339.1 septal ring factor EnvC (AmiA/AmiB activator) [Pseudomonas flavescens]
MIYRYTGAALALLLLQGCATDPAPSEQMRLTEQVIEQARTVAAGETVAELTQAEDKLARARSAMDEEAYRTARVQAEQAELDARLAEARVLTLRSQAQLTELNRHIKRLRDQLGAMP